MLHKTLKLAAHLLCPKKRPLCVVLRRCYRLGRINALFGKQTAFFGSVTALLGIVNAFLGKLSALLHQNGAVSLRSHHQMHYRIWIKLKSHLNQIEFAFESNWKAIRLVLEDGRSGIILQSRRFCRGALPMMNDEWWIRRLRRSTASVIAA